MKRNRIAILLALLVGIVSVAPQVYVLFDSTYRGVQMFGTDAEYEYVGRVNQAQYEDYSKGPFPTDPGKNYYLAPKLGERTMMLAAKILHVRAIEITVIFKIICSVLLFLILYGWLMEMFSSQSVALLSPLFIMLGINLLNTHNFFVDTFLTYTRPISPQQSSILLFLGIWSIYRLWYHPSRMKTAVFLGALAGISLYVYIYTWVYLSVLLGLFVLFFLIRRNKEKATYFFAALAINIVISLPFFLNLLKARQDQDYLDTAARLGLVHTHAPILGIWIVIGLLLVLFAWPKEYNHTKHFFLFLWMALLVSLNQQIITGFKLQPGHFHWWNTKPLIAIIAIVLIGFWMKKMIASKTGTRAILVGIGFLLFLNGVAVQARSFSANYPTYEKNQTYAPILARLDTAYAERKVVWASPHLTALILAYTPHYAPNSSFLTYSEGRYHIKERLFLGYRLRGVESDDILDAMKREKDFVTGRMFGIYHRDLPGSQGLSHADFEQLAEEYRIFSSKPLHQVLGDLGIDAIIADDGTLHEVTNI